MKIPPTQFHIQLLKREESTGNYVTTRKCTQHPFLYGKIQDESQVKGPLSQAKGPPNT